MRKLTDKLIILLLCCILNGASDAASVAAFLTTLCSAADLQYRESQRLSGIIGVLSLFLSLLIPEFLFFLPALLYDFTARRLWWICAAAGGCFVYHAADMDMRRISALLLTALLAVLLQRRTTALLAVEKKYIQTRDSSAEITMLLTEKNRHLHENQDNEIRLATLRERNRIAREIHDNVGHLLSRSILQTGALCAMNRDETMQEALSALNDTLSSAMTTIRKSVHDLHDESVDLKQSVEEAVRPLSENGLRVRLEFDCTADPPNKIKFCLISIVKEGTSNILRHSSADSVSVILREHPAFYQLMIEDNGICEAVNSTDGIGLSNMRERVESLGGILQISADKTGFRIFISLKKETNRK